MTLPTKPFRLCVAAILVALSACHDESAPDPDAPVQVGDPATVILEQTRQFVADFPGVAPEQIWWRATSNDPLYGSIDANGLFTAGAVPLELLVIATPPAESGLAPDTSVVTTRSLRPTTSVGFGAYSVTASANGKVAGADGLDSIWVREGDSTRAAYFPGWPVSIALSPSGTDLYIAQLTGRVIRINVATLTAIDTVMLSDEALQVEVRPTDGTVYATDLGGWLYRLDGATLAKLDSLHLAFPSSGLAFGPGATTLWASTTEDGKVYKIQAASLDVLDAFTLGNGTQRLAVSPSGDSVYVANQAKDSLFIIRPATGAVNAIPVCCGPQAVAISNDGKQLYVAQAGGAVAHFDRATLQLLGATAVGSTTRDVTAVPGTSVIYAAGEIDAARIK